MMNRYSIKFAVLQLLLFQWVATQTADMGPDPDEYWSQRDKCDPKVVDKFAVLIITAPGPNNVTEATDYCDTFHQVVTSISRNFHRCIHSVRVHEAFEGIGSLIESSLNRYCATARSLETMVHVSRCLDKIRKSVHIELLYAQHVAIVELAARKLNYPSSQQQERAVCISYRNVAEKLNQFVLAQCGAQSFDFVYSVLSPLIPAYNLLCGDDANTGSITDQLTKLDPDFREKVESIMRMTSIPETKYSTSIPALMKLMNNMD